MSGIEPKPGREIRGTDARVTNASLGGLLQSEIAECLPPGQREWPNIIGYQIAGVLGSGGMGTVYKARQLSTNRDVALKVMSSEVTRSRRLCVLFAQEVRLAARLQHPNIVRVYDSGIASGLHYYAMELVEGETLDRYVQNGLREIGARSISTSLHSFRKIVELMQRACEGVQHAHLRGVIHRDLKPRNIVVCSDGQPHVLDFGLATVVLQAQVSEASEPQSSDNSGTVIANAGSNAGSGMEVRSAPDFAGTPAFMSPEQTLGRPSELDIRTDVYSLGVTLYLLLTGQMPIDVTGSSVTVMLRVAQGAIRPPRTLDRRIDHELEAIVLKSLALDRNDRYASAGAMAEDLGRYLTHRPLLALRLTPTYVLRKWMVRHRRAAIGAACISLVLTVLTVHSFISQRELRRTSNDLADFLQTLDSVIGQLSPQVVGRQIGNRDLLNGFADDATVKFSNRRPRELAAVLDRVGMTLLDQGWARDAERRIASALEFQVQSDGETSLESVKMTNDLAEVKREVGKFAESATLSRHALNLAEKLPGSQSQRLRARIELAYALDDQGRIMEAESNARSALELSHSLHPQNQRHPDVLRAQNTLAFVLRDQRKLPEARELASAALEARRVIFGETHPDTIRSMDVYATILYLIGDTHSLDESRRWIDKAVNLSETTLGLDHADRLTLLNDEGMILCGQGNYAEAESCLRKALELSTRLVGEEDRSSVVLMCNLAVVLHVRANDTNLSASQNARLRDQLRKDAQELLSKVIQLRTHSTGDEDPSVLLLIDALAAVESERGQLANAQGHYEKTLHAREKMLSATDPLLISSLRNVARVMQYQNKWSNAENLYRQAWKKLTISPGASPSGVQEALNELNLARQQQKEPPESVTQ